MTFSANLVNFAVSTGAIGTTQNVAHGLSAAPTVMIGFWNGRTESVDTSGTANHRRGIGFAGSSPTTDRRCRSGVSDDAATTARANFRCQNDCFVTNVTTAAAGKLDINSVDATNVQFIVDEVFAVALRVFLLVMTGTDITVSVTGAFNAPLAAGNQTVTVTGFTAGATDQAVFFMGGKDNDATDNTVGVSSAISFGVMAGSAAEEAVWVGWSDDEANPTTMNTGRYCLRGECIAVPDPNVATPQTNGTGIVGRAQAHGTNPWLTDGFQINWIETPGNSPGPLIYFLAIKGLQFAVGEILTSTTLGANVNSETEGFTPVGAILVSAGLGAFSIADQTTGNDSWSMGVWTGLTTRGSMWIGDEDAAGTSDVYTAVEFDNVWINKVPSTGAADGLADIDVIADPFQLDMTEGGSAARIMWYLSFAGAAAPPVTTPSRPLVVLDAVKRAASW